MLALVLAAVTAVSTPPTDMARTIVTDVCLPYVAGEARAGEALGLMGFVATAADEDTRNFRTADEAYLLRLTTTGSTEDGNLNRVCVIQARRGGLDGTRASLQPVLREQGFAPEADSPADRPIWTKGGVTVSLRQNEGRATLIRVTFSSLDAD